MASLTQRMIRAAKLDVSLYEEVEADRGAMKQAIAVVILSSLAAGVSTLSSVSTRDLAEPMSGSFAIGSLLMATVAALAAWFIWAFLTYFIGTRLLPEPQTHADVGQLLRTTGFSSSPGILRIFGLVPGLWGLITMVTALWMLAAMVIAVRQALDYHSTLRAVGVCILGWFVQALFLLLLYGIPRNIQPVI